MTTSRRIEHVGGVGRAISRAISQGFGDTENVYHWPLLYNLEDSTGTYTMQYKQTMRTHVFDHENILRQCKDSTPMFPGARLVANMQSSTDDFTSASWTAAAGVTVGTGETDPEGGSTANSYATTVASAYLTNDLSSDAAVGAVSCWSIWVKRLTGSGDFFVVDGLTSTNLGVDGTWKRYSVTYTQTNAYRSFRIGSADTSSTFAIWGPQWEEVTGQAIQGPSEYVEEAGTGRTTPQWFGTTNGTTVVANVVTEGTGTALTGMKGLYNRSRGITNYVSAGLYRGTSGRGFSGTLTQDQIGVDGVPLTALLYDDSNAGTTEGETTNHTGLNSSRRYTWWRFIKKKSSGTTRAYFHNELSGGTTELVQITFDPVTGVCTFLNTPPTDTVTGAEDCGDWWKLWITHPNVGANTTLQMRMYPCYTSTDGGSADVTLTGTLICDWEQVEDHTPYPTYPIIGGELHGNCNLQGSLIPVTDWHFSLLSATGGGIAFTRICAAERTGSYMSTLLNLGIPNTYWTDQTTLGSNRWTSQSPTEHADTAGNHVMAAGDVQHWAGSWDGTTKVLYQNGADLELTTPTYTGTIFTDTNYQAGLFQGSSGNFRDIYLYDHTPSAATLAAISSIGDNTLLTGLVSYWPLDEQVGNARDAHGTNELTDTNTVTSAAGHLSTSRQFTRANFEDFRIDDNATLPFGSSSWTITGWFYVETAITGANLTMWGQNGTRIRISSTGAWRPRMEHSGGNVQITTMGSAADATWYFVTVWCDTTAETFNCSIDDGTVHSLSYAGNTPTDGTGRFCIGSDSGSAQYGGRGEGVGMWNRVLTAAEITEVYNGGSTLAYPFTAANILLPLLIPIIF